MTEQTRLAMGDDGRHPPIVLITGGSAGIGLEAAKRFHAAGAYLILIGRDRGRLQAARDTLGVRVDTISADIGCRDDLDRIAAHIDTTYGRLDALVNNAGFHERGPFAHIDAVDAARMVAVNLEAPIYLTRVLLDLLLKSHGHIINVASLAGRLPVPGSATYGATKFGLRAWSLALGDELRAAGVRVSCVSPGPVDTQFIMNHIDSVSDITFSQPVVKPERVASAIFHCYKQGGDEICVPQRTRYLTTVGYLFPSIRRMLRPLLERKGAKKKKRLKQARAPSREP
ncbi:MAG: SDR family NAD(P)-dependent oxidoreductase [Bradymonadia bacterium]